MPFRFSLHRVVFAVLSAGVLSTAHADIQTSNSSYSFSQRALSTTGNAGAAAYVIEKKEPHVAHGGMISVGAAIEYGDFDELFDAINQLSDDFKPIDSEEDTPAQLPEEPTDGDERRVDWDQVFETYPELEDRLSLIKSKVVSTVALISIIATEGYGKAELDSEVSFVLNDDLFGGTILFGASFNGYSKAVGLLDAPVFDVEKTRTQLAKIPTFNENDPLQELELGGGVQLSYDPSSKKAKVSVDNDSLLLVKSAKISKFLLTYSNKSFTNQYGSFYWGVKPTFYNVGLNNLSIRLGDITDSEQIFDDISNAQYQYEQGFDMDLGAVWAAKNYQLGASLNNLAEASFKYPEIDTRGFTSQSIVDAINNNSKFVLERQLKLEASIFSENSHWSLNLGLDANAIEDPMKDEFQWFNASAGYASGNWWFPSARVGFSRNLVGSELSYLTAGTTFMNVINLDVSTTLDSVVINDVELKRGLDINLGVQFDY